MSALSRNQSPKNQPFNQSLPNLPDENSIELSVRDEERRITEISLLRSFQADAPTPSPLLELSTRELKKLDPGGKTWLMFAALHGNLVNVELLLSKHCPINAESNKKETAFTYAVRNGHLAVAECLLNNQCDIFTRNTKGQSALIKAVQSRSPAMVQFVYQQARGLNRADNDGCTPLYYALRENVPEIAAFLLEKGAKTDTYNNHGWHLSHLVAAVGDPALFEFLHSRGLFLNVRDNFGSTPLHVAAFHGNGTFCARIISLYNVTSHLEDINDQGYTPLLLALEQDHYQDDAIRVLLDSGCMLPKGTHYSIVSFALDRPRSLEILLNFLVEKDNYEAIIRPNEEGLTPLDVALLENKTESIEILINVGALKHSVLFIDSLYDLESQLKKADEEGWTPLHYAAFNGHIESIRTLCPIYSMDKLNLINCGNFTPLSEAVYNEKLEAVKLLLIHGAWVNPHEPYHEYALAEFLAEHDRENPALKVLLSSFIRRNGGLIVANR